MKKWLIVLIIGNIAGLLIMSTILYIRNCTWGLSEWIAISTVLLLMIIATVFIYIKKRGSSQ